MRGLQHIVIFLFLTVLTQVGGLIYLFCRLTVRYAFPKSKRTKNWHVLTFLIVYLLSCFILIPALAPLNGRKALPIHDFGIQPQNWFTVLANRHYVSHDLYDLTLSVCQDFSVPKAEGPERAVRYLDANFPFVNGFPLLPHLSHNDGKKLDLAFRYKDLSNSSLHTNRTPALFGYGVYVEPTDSEIHQTDLCKENHWQYDITKYIGLRVDRNQLVFDQHETKR